MNYKQHILELDKKLYLNNIDTILFKHAEYTLQLHRLCRGKQNIKQLIYSQLISYKVAQHINI